MSERDLSDAFLLGFLEADNFQHGLPSYLKNRDPLKRH